MRTSSVLDAYVCKVRGVRAPACRSLRGAHACRDALAARALRRRMLLKWREAAAACRTLRLQEALAVQHAEHCNCCRALWVWRHAVQLRVAAHRLADCRAAALQCAVFKGWQQLTAACRCSLPLQSSVKRLAVPAMQVLFEVAAALQPCLLDVSHDMCDVNHLSAACRLPESCSPRAEAAAAAQRRRAQCRAAWLAWQHWLHLHARPRKALRHRACQHAQDTLAQRALAAWHSAAGRGHTRRVHRQAAAVHRASQLQVACWHGWRRVAEAGGQARHQWACAQAHHRGRRLRRAWQLWARQAAARRAALVRREHLACWRVRRQLRRVWGAWQVRSCRRD